MVQFALRMTDASPNQRGTAVPEELRRASLRASVHDGVCWAIMHGAGERYVAPFVVLGGTSYVGLALAVALPALAGALVQCFSAERADRSGRRKRMFVAGAVAQGLLWFLAAGAALLPSAPAYVAMVVVYLLLLALHNYTVPPWTSLMGDLVPEDRRGRYFGARNFLLGMAIVVSFFGAGWWLEHARTALPGGIAWGFLTIFLVAGLARLGSAWFLSRMYEPVYLPAPAERFTFGEFLRRMPHGPFGRFTLYAAWLHLGVGVAGPFFTIYFLRVLGLRPHEFASLVAAHLLAYYGAHPLVGRLADRIGNKRVLAAGGIGIGLIPLWFLLSRDYGVLLAIQIYDGFVWAAFNLGSSNYLFDVVSPPKRARCTAYFTLMISAGGLAGAFLGAGVAHAVRAQIPFETLLWISAGLRLLPSLLLLRTFGEARIRPMAATPAHVA
jgi:MFS family permease